MKRSSTIAKNLMLVAFVLMVLAPYCAKASLTTVSSLNSQGITSRNFNVISISPNNRYICGYAREPRKSGTKQQISTIYILPITSQGSIGKARSYPLEGVNRIEQACFTPDSNSIVFITKAGAEFTRLDIATGTLETIMTYKKGSPGFRSYPEILRNSGNEMLAQGYFYDANNYAGRNIIAVLNPYKSGVGAFTIASDIQKAQQSMRRTNRVFTETFPRKDVGFMTIHIDGSCMFYRWNDSSGIKNYDKSKELLSAWGGGSRLLYSTKRHDNTCDLCIYDGISDKKITIDSKRKNPYMYVVLSADGRTAIFNDVSEKRDTTTLYYAKESENWKILPVKNIPSKIPTGSMRISDDGTKAIFHNSEGIRILNI